MSKGRLFSRPDPMLLAGHDVTTRMPAHLPLSALRSTATFVAGSSGSGKSFFLRHLIGLLICLRQSLTIIDPHRELAEFTLWRLRRAGVPPEHIIYIDPSNDRYCPALNPLTFSNDPAEAASLACDCFARAWNSNTEETPRLTRMLSTTFRTLIDAGLSLAEAPELLQVDAKALRVALRERVGDEFVRREWVEYEALSRGEKLAMVESARSRLRRALQLEGVRRMFGQTQNVVNLRRMMDEGRYLILNLGGISAPEVQKLIASLTLSGLYHAARQRDTRNRRDHFVIADEFSEMASPDVAQGLDATRKMGLYWILAFQRFGQLTKFNSDLLSSVLTNARNRFVLSGLSKVDAELMRDELFTGAIRTDRVKHVSVGTRFRPGLGTFEVHTESGSEAESESDSWGTSSGSSEGDTDGTSRQHRGDRTPDPEDEMLGVSEGRSRSSSSSESSGGSRSLSTTRGWSRSVVPIVTHSEFHEETGRVWHSLEDERHRHLAKVVNLAHREVLFRLQNGPVQHIRTPDVAPERIDARFHEFHEQVMRKCPEVLPASVVVERIEERRKQLTGLVEASEDKGRPFQVRSFRE
jgi:hypothetical protein